MGGSTHLVLHFALGYQAVVKLQAKKSQNLGGSFQGQEYTGSAIATFAVPIGLAAAAVPRLVCPQPDTMARRAPRPVGES